MFGKSAEDKAAEKQAKQEAKDRAAMEKFGLDFDSYTEADIRRKNINSAKEIAGSLAGSKMYSFGSLFTGSRSVDIFKHRFEEGRVNCMSFFSPLCRTWDNHF